MEITEVKLVLKEGPDKKLKAYATLTFDNCFVVRNIKVIKGNKGLFVAMPSRKIREACPKCNYKNPIRSKFCNQCGSSIPMPAMKHETEEARQSEHRDIAHPITLECREYIQRKVLDTYEAEVRKSQSSAGDLPQQPPREEATAPREESRHDEDTGDIEL